MRNKVIEFDTIDAFPLAEQYFIRTSGIDFVSEKHKRMWNRAVQVYEEVQKKIKLRALLSVFSPDELDGKNLSINNVIFTCNAFEQLSKNNIRRVYAYILTAGAWMTESSEIVDQLYADIWGTSFVDAGRDLLKNQIKMIEKEQSEDTVLSESFGPGFYGMDLSQVGRFFQILNSDLIDVILHNSGTMLPQKSIAGFYLALTDENEIPDKDCENCVGNPTGCRFCRAGRLCKNN